MCAEPAALVDTAACASASSMTTPLSPESSSVTTFWAPFEESVPPPQAPSATAPTTARARADRFIRITERVIGRETGRP